jgi:hypothetical protein
VIGSCNGEKGTILCGAENDVARVDKIDGVDGGERVIRSGKAQR